MHTNDDDNRRRKLLQGWAGRSPSTFWPPPTRAALNITYYITAVLHIHYNVLNSTGIWNGIVCCGSVHTTCVDGFTARDHGPSTRVDVQKKNSLAPLANFFRAPSKSRLAPDIVSLNWLSIWTARFSDASAAYDDDTATMVAVAYHLPCRCSSVRVAEHKILMTRSDDVQWTCIANILVTNRISV